MYKNVDLSGILGNFNINNFETEKIKEKVSRKSRIVYKIKYFDNFFCLKQTYFDIKNILFIYSYLQWLHLYNFNIPYLIKSNQNKPFIKYNNKFYILTKWIDGKKLDYDNFDECIYSIIFLSKIHEASNNVLFINGANKREIYTNLKSKFIKNTNELYDLYSSAKIYKDNFSDIFISYFEDCINLAKISKRYASLINSKNLNTSICHGDYVNKNILVQNKNQISPIDFDRSCISFSMNDLGYFLRRYLRRANTNWNFKSAIKLINYYDKNNPLYLDDYLYLFSYLSFPQKFLKISKFYFENIEYLSNNQKLFQEHLLMKNCISTYNQLEFTYLFEEYINANFNIFKKIKS